MNHVKTHKWITSLPQTFLDSNEGDIGSSMVLVRRLCDQTSEAYKHCPGAHENPQARSVRDQCQRFLVSTHAEVDLDERLGRAVQLRNSITSSLISLMLILSTGKLRTWASRTNR